MFHQFPVDDLLGMLKWGLDDTFLIYDPGPCLAGCGGDI